MIAEPYICIKGPKAGEIEWKTSFCMKLGVPIGDDTGNRWKPYADFEREKIKELSKEKRWRLWLEDDIGWCLGTGKGAYCHYDSSSLTNYFSYDWRDASESSRTLKRAEFLKAVCEKEGVEWLPKPYTAEDVDREIVKDCCNICGDNRGMFDHGKWWCWPCWKRRSVFRKPKSIDVVKVMTEEEECKGCAAADGIDTLCDKHHKEQAYRRLDHLLDLSAKIMGIPRSKIGPIPELDYYTKEQIDDRMSQILTFICGIHPGVKEKAKELLSSMIDQ